MLSRFESASMTIFNYETEALGVLIEQAINHFVGLAERGDDHSVFACGR